MVKKTIYQDEVIRELPVSHRLSCLLQCQLDATCKETAYVITPRGPICYFLRTKKIPGILVNRMREKLDMMPSFVFEKGFK